MNHPLVTKYKKTWATWFDVGGWTQRGWVTTREGKVYTRWNALTGRLDIASVELREKYRGKGILKALIAAARGTGASRVRLESIQVERLAKSASAWVFPGWSSQVSGSFDKDHCCITVEWMRSAN